MALIYIVEDDDNIREIEKFALKNNGHIIYDFADTQSFLKKISDKIPELAIIDVMLPDRDGYEIVESLRANPKTKKLPIIMVTAKTTELDMIRGLELGADDYIKKPFSVIELMTRVKALLRRSAMDTEQEKVMELGNIVLNDKRHFVSVDGEQIELTYKEFELLKFLMINTGIVMTRESIMHSVWGVDFELESRTVDMHIKTLRQKLKTGAERIKTIRNVGYVME